jgi:hypothetical protein
MMAYTGNSQQMAGHLNPALLNDSNEDIASTDDIEYSPKFRRSLVLPAFFKSLTANKTNEISLINKTDGQDVRPHSIRDVFPKIDFYVKEDIKERRPNLEDLHLPLEYRTQKKVLSLK